jgi:hypothetical protein
MNSPTRKHVVKIDFVRTLRTASSERFILRREEQPIGALELHYLPNGKADGTLILFEEMKIPETDIPDILKQIDDQLLPDLAAKEQNIFFTVVIGKVHGSFEPHP